MSTATSDESVQILLVEDSPGDALLTRKAFSESRLPSRLHVVSDGIEALSFLHKEGQYLDCPTPHVILLDLNMPRKNGREVLRDIKQDQELRCIPVMILTTSDDREDVAECYRLHANCYITKPVGFYEFLEAVEIIERFWFKLVRLTVR